MMATVTRAAGRPRNPRVATGPERQRLRTCKPAPGGTLPKIAARTAASGGKARVVGRHARGLSARDADGRRERRARMRFALHAQTSLGIARRPLTVNNHE